MAERNSEYARLPGDSYWTPQWVYDALFEVEEFNNPWDCAPRDADFDFLEHRYGVREIATNPPYSLAEKFILHSLAVTKSSSGKAAMLLPMAFEANGRRNLFEFRPFKAKYVITRRIRWENLPQKKAGPSQNHAWFVWDWFYRGKPTLGYLPRVP